MKKVTLSMSALVAMALSAQAAAIIWSAPTTVVNENDIDLTGTAVHAGYWGADNGTLGITAGSETVSFDYRGNPLAQDGSDSGSVAYIAAGYALDLNSPPSNDFFISTGTVGDADFDTMMSGAIVDSAGGMTLTLSGLTEGDTYQVQLFASDDRTSGTRAQRYGDNLGNYSDTFAQNTSPSVVGIFTADASGKQTILIEGVSDINKQVFSGYALRAIPEPGSYALLGGLLALGCVMVRRRR